MIDLLGKNGIEAVPESSSAEQIAPEQGISNLEADERAYEQSEEAREHFLEDQSGEESFQAEQNMEVVSPTATVVSAPPAVEKSETMIRVEKVLETGLGDVYQALTPEAQTAFRLKGEETAKNIGQMVDSLKIEVKKILHWIREWLMLVPHSNKFFLEQEAKIKTDQILELVRARQEDMTQHP